MTAGLALAVRLSEDQSVTVAVLEAGNDTIDDPAVAIPGQYGLTIADPKYDWTFFTRKQPFANDKEILWSRGKGGSSTINSFAWSKPPAGDIDVIEKLGNPGWNWKDYHHYSKKSERFFPPLHEVTELFPHTYDLDARGTSGPIHYTITPHAHTIDTVVRETSRNLGLKVIDDPYKGDINGTWVASANLDPETWTRSDSASAYLKPHKDRNNLVVLPNALVSRVVFADKLGDDDELVATGVEFIHKGIKHVVNARKEIILSTGVPVTPKILELSGIGRRDILNKIGIEVKLELPGVGENLQEHLLFGATYELDPSVNHQTLDWLRDPEYAKEARHLIAEGKGLMRTCITCFNYFPLSSVRNPSAAKTADSIAKDIEEYKKQSDIPPGLSEQLNLQLESLRNDSIPEMEIAAFPGVFSTQEVTPEPGKTYTSFLALLNHPVSRGTVHARSSDPEDYPDIDPHYFEKDSDLELLVEHLKYIRTMVQTEPLKSGIVGVELHPGPECETDEQMRGVWD
ncbi:hypothetical protein C0991_009486 [Blastosporella zonata]|nr:hypothetical protein C0991_009486 [Blastosporella zonata]